MFAYQSLVWKFKIRATASNVWMVMRQTLYMIRAFIGVSWDFLTIFWGNFYCVWIINLHVTKCQNEKLNVCPYEIILSWHFLNFLDKIQPDIFGESSKSCLIGWIPVFCHIILGLFSLLLHIWHHLSDKFMVPESKAPQSQRGPLHNDRCHQ